MNTKKLFTLNRQLFDKETKVKIGDIESYCPTFDIDEVQERIQHIRYNMQKEFDCHSEITSRGNESWSKDYIYAFTVYGKNHGACYWVECHDLPISRNTMWDNDLR